MTRPAAARTPSAEPTRASSGGPGSGLLGRVSPEPLIAASAVSLYAGASIAVLLFDRIGPGSSAWLRVLFAGLILVIVRRSWRRTWTKLELQTSAAFGISLAAMNLCFYLAADHLHLGTAVAIEFLGPIAVAAYSLRSRRSLGALLIALVGIGLLADVQWEGSRIGVFYALGAAVLWMGYILLGSRVAKSGAMVDGLGVGMIIGALVITPFGLGSVGNLVEAPVLLLVAGAVAVLSNVIPYGFDMVALRRISAGRYAFLLALLPATATIMGFIVLSQRPSPAELAGIGLVVVALLVRGSE